MKFWKKIFSYSVILFVIFLNLAGMLIVERTFEDNLQEGINAVVNKCRDVENTLYLNADYLYDVDVSNRESIKSWVDIIVKGYILNMSKKQFNLELYTEDDKQILSDWERHVADTRPELEQADMDTRKFLIRTVDGRRYVFISSIINIKNTSMKLILSSDIENVYEKRIEDYEFFLLVSLGISCILAFGMYIISIKLTKPIRSLSESAMEIAKGDYGARVTEYGGEDEIEILKHNFNKMAEVIEEKIMELHYHNEAQQRFIDSLNHEIKTPITSIIGYSELLLRSKVDEKIKEQALQYINSEARRLSVLNNTMLKLTLLREEESKREPVAVSSCINNAVLALSYKLEQKNNHIHMEIEDTKVIADRSQLEVLFINLIDNACKASSEGQEIVITGAFDQDKECYQVKIEDHGIGIAAEDLDKILEPFYMTDKVRTRKENGLGLGLAICNEICMKNQVIMSFESTVGAGTSVTVMFVKENIVR